MRFGIWKSNGPWVVLSATLLGAEFGCGGGDSGTPSTGGAGGDSRSGGGSVSQNSGGASVRGGAGGAALGGAGAATNATGGTDAGGAGGAGNGGDTGTGGANNATAGASTTGGTTASGGKGGTTATGGGTTTTTGGAGGNSTSGSGGRSGAGGTLSSGGTASGGSGTGGTPCPSFSGQKPLDLLLLVEQTRFLADPTQGAQGGTYFSEMVRGLSNFVSNAAAKGTGVGVQYFPLKGSPDSCSANYATPELEVSAIPGAASALKASFAAHAPTNDVSAYAPALTSAIAHMKSWGQAHPTRRPVVVLMATLAEIACGTWDQLYDVAQAGFESTPSVETYVISLLTDSSRSVAISDRSHSNPVIVDSQANIGNQIEQGLLALTNPASVCQLEYPVFEPPFPFTDSQLSLLYTANATGAPSEIPRVASAAGCATGSGLGWYLDSGGLPKIMRACAGSCATFVGGTLTARVNCP
ncbi:MAG: hypothetical protein QM756_33120 [Polyangiaceae bacterium]